MAHYKFSVVNFVTKYEFHTNNKELAEKKAILKNATMYYRPRYNAEMRLIRLYNYLISVGRLPIEICYPEFLN